MSTAGSPVAAAATAPEEAPPDTQEAVAKAATTPAAAPNTPSPSPPGSPELKAAEMKTEAKDEEGPAVVKTIHCFLCGGLQVSVNALVECLFVAYTRRECCI